MTFVRRDGHGNAAAFLNRRCACGNRAAAAVVHANGIGVLLGFFLLTFADGYIDGFAFLKGRSGAGGLADNLAGGVGGP